MASKSAKQRPVWKGFIKIGLVTFPVRALSARIKAKSEIDLDWLHAAALAMAISVFFVW